MSWLGWLILGPYLAGCLLAWRWIAYAAAADMGGNTNEPVRCSECGSAGGRHLSACRRPSPAVERPALDVVDVVFGMFAATLTAGFWPLIALCLLVRHSLRWRGPALIGPAPWTEAARERRVEAAIDVVIEQEQRIERLERELGIGKER